TLTSLPDLYPLSLHDALPICQADARAFGDAAVDLHADLAALDHVDVVDDRTGVLHLRHEIDAAHRPARIATLDVEGGGIAAGARSEEHTSELQSRENLVCRLL